MHHQTLKGQNKIWKVVARTCWKSRSGGDATFTLHKVGEDAVTGPEVVAG